MSESVILEEDIDENYEPTQQEIEEYARFLQMDLPEDNDLLWIAKEGLKAPLPEPWKPCKTRDDEIYYFNFESGESTWEHPCDDYYRKQYLAHKGQKSNKQSGAGVKKKRLPDPSLPFDFVDNSASKKPASPNLAFKGFDDKEKDPVLKFEMEKKLKREKQEMEERYSAEVAQVNKEFEDKRTQYRRNYDRDAEMLKKQDLIRREEFELEHKRWLEAELDRAKSSAQRDLDAEEISEKNRIQSEHQREKQRVADEFADRLAREQQRLRAQQTEERDSLLQSEESVKMSEIRRVTQETEQLKARLAALKSDISTKEQQNGRDIAAAESAAQREIADTVARLRADNDLRITLERKTTEDRFQREAERLRSQSGEDSRRSVATLQQLETDIKTETSIRLQKVETDAEMEFLDEKDKLQKEYLAKMRDLADAEAARSKVALAQELEAYRQKARRDLENEKLAKETEANRNRLDFQKRLEQDWERQQEEFRLRGRTEPAADKTEARAQVARLKQALADVQREVDALEKESERTSEAISTAQRSSQPMEAPQVDSQQLTRLEREMETLKQLVLRKESISPIPVSDPVETPNWKATIQREKQEIRELQKALELDRERWRLEVRDLELHPGSRSRMELQSVKKALDAKTRKLNDRIHELRTTESWLQRQEAGRDRTFDFDLEDEVLERKITENEGKDSIFELSDDLGSGDRGRVGQPIGYYHASDATMISKLQSYDRQLNTFALRRDQARAQVAKADSWLTGAKDDLRMYGTPSRDFP